MTALARPWRVAMARALYGATPGGADGFYRRERPADHFSTSAHVSPSFAGALLELCRRVGAGTVVDMGSGSGELLHRMQELSGGQHLIGVDLRPRPTELADGVEWTQHLPRGLEATLLVANEWLDNVPVDVVEAAPDGALVRVEVDGTGAESFQPFPGFGPDAERDAGWLARWWPLPQAHPMARAEIGWPRDDAWREAVSALRSGVAVAIDYGHLVSTRPRFGSIAAYRRGRQVQPVPDGTCDITAHVALDACAEAGIEAGATSTVLLDQRAALRALGLSGRLPDVARASDDPAGYLRSLSAATATAELLDPAGLGGFTWLVQGVGVDVSGVFGGRSSASAGSAEPPGGVAGSPAWNPDSSGNRAVG